MWPSEAERVRMQPFPLRAEGLDRLLTPQEFGIALFHTVKRRGHVPRSFEHLAGVPTTSDAAEAPMGPLASAATRNEMRAAGYRTAGEMLAADPYFTQRKRNRAGDYRSALSRPLVEQEVTALFAAQRRLGSPVAGAAVEQAFVGIAFAQLPRSYADTQYRCAYMPDQPLGARRSPTIERYMFLDALTKLRLMESGNVRRLDAQEIGRVMARFGRVATVTRLDVRRWLALPPQVKFADGRHEDRDIVSARGAAYGTVVLRSVLGRTLWGELSAQPGVTDRLADAITFSRDAGHMVENLAGLDVPASVVSALVEAYGEGDFDGFIGTGRLSNAAAASLLPFLAEGHLVFDAAVKAGFNPLAFEQQILHRVRQPKIVRPVLETMKQVHALIQETGMLPGRIHVEIARDLGLTPDQRTAAEESYRKIAQARQAARETLMEIVPQAGVNDALVDRYMLWQEQGGQCVYTGKPIDVLQLLDGAVVQVDHIQPVSRSNDHSRNNTVVCFSYANQAKGNRTPFEWQGKDATWWAAFSGRIGWMPLSPRKRRLLLAKEFAQHEGSVLTRNLNDTSYVARCVMTALRALYPKSEGYKRVVARPGRLTAVLRRTWGFSKDRADVRNHALDALIVAVSSDRSLYELSQARKRDTSAIGIALPLPWPGFRVAVLSALSEVKVSKSEQKRGRGAGHAMTVRRARIEEDGERMLFERRPIHRLRRSDLDRIPDPDVNGPLIQSLKAWLDAGSPEDAPPLSPQGDPIRRVRIRLTGKTGISRDGIEVRGGVASYSGLVRVDLYRAGTKYAVVPVHAVDVETMAAPPLLAPQQRKQRKDWMPVGDKHQFLFSIYRNSLLRITNRNGVVVEGFFRGLEQSSIRLTLADPLMPRNLTRASVGAAVHIEKFQVDRLGRRFPVLAEMRTWRGRNCPWPGEPNARQNKTSMAEV